MLKRTLAIFTLAMCGFMNFQAMEAVSFSQPVEIEQETDIQDQIACCGKKNPKKKRASLVVEETLAGCKRCRNRHLA